MALNDYLLTGKDSLLYKGMTSFKFSNFVEKNDTSPTSSVQFEDGVMSNPCNKYE